MSGAIIPGGPRVPAELVTDAGVNIESDGDPVVHKTGTIDFEGAGVSVDNVDGIAVVTITGGGSGIAIDQNGTPVVSVATTINFSGSGVAATDSGGGVVNVSIPGGGGGGTVFTNGTLTGDGSSGDPLGVNSASLDHTVTVAVDGTTIGGSGITGQALHTIDGATGVAVDGTTIAGTGKTGAPLHTVDGGTGVATDGTTITGTGKTGAPLHVAGAALSGTVPVAVDSTLTGNGLTGSPLHVVGGAGSSITVFRPPTPANGGTVALHANALNAVDIQNVANNGLLLNLPAANSVPAGTPLWIALVNRGAYADLQRGPFTIPPGLPGINAMLLTVTGGDTINSVGVGGINACFTKVGDTAMLYSDGVSDWIVAQSTWTNVTKASFALVVSGLGNQLLTETDGPVPNQIYCSAAADGTQVISLSAGYFGQICTITNTGTHAFLIVPDEVAIPLNGNCCYMTGNAQDYRVDPGESIQVQFGQIAAGGVPHLWYVIGHNTQLS